MTKLSTVILASGSMLAMFAGQSNAQTVLFSDSFNRADSRDIQASLTGVTDNTGSSLAAGGIYSQPHLDPNNAAPTYGVQDGDASNGGGAAISSSMLELSIGAGTANAYVNHNFVNNSILSAGGFSISLDVTGYAGTGIGQGGAFAIGMSASEAASAGDAYGNTDPSMTRAFNDGGSPNSSIGNDISLIGTQPVVSDFWVALRGNGSLIWGGSSGTIQGVTGLSKTGTISATFKLTDFNLGSTVDYEIFYNGTSEGTGSFAWSGTDENYIGLDSRDGTGVTMDNLNISTIAPVPEPSTLAMFALGAAGFLIRRRKA